MPGVRLTQWVVWADIGYNTGLAAQVDVAGLFAADFYCQLGHTRSTLCNKHTQCLPFNLVMTEAILLH